MNPSDIGRGPAKPIPAELETVNGFIDMMTAKHAEFYHENPDAEFQPLLMVLCENGDLIPVMVDGFGNDDQKDLFCAQMRVAFKLWRVKSYVFAMEAWLSYAAAKAVNPDGTIDSDKSASKQSDRKEVVFTIAIDKDGNKAKSCLEIIRDYKGGAHVVPFDLPPEADFAGRFAELL